MGTKLYVGNLSYTTTEASLRAAFEKIGPVKEASIVNDRETGRSKGFGFIHMTNEADAQSAIQAMDGRELDGRRLRVNEAQDKPAGARGGFGGGGGGGGGPRHHDGPRHDGPRGGGGGYRDRRD